MKWPVANRLEKRLDKVNKTLNKIVRITNTKQKIFCYEISFNPDII